MQRREGTGRRITLALGALVYGLWIGAADARAQSLGELAAREAARRAAITTPAPIYTNLSGKDGQPGSQPAEPAAHVDTSSIVIAAPAPAAVTLSVALASVVTRGTGIPGLPTARPISRVENGSTAGARASTEPASHAGDPAPTQPPALSSLAGWSAFQIKKTAVELAQQARLSGVGEVAPRTLASDLRQPPQQDTMRMSSGLGYLVGGDWGGDVAGSGNINGMQTHVAAFFTAGPMGLQPRSGRVSLFTPDGRWRAEGGDLYSDLGGLARGARLSRTAGQRWAPSLSVYFPRAAGRTDAPIAAYRDRLQLLPRVRVGGELASSGAGFLQVQYAQPKLDLTAFYRVVPGSSGGRDQGVSGGLSVWRGVALSGAVRVSDAINDSNRWQLASIRLPLTRQASVTLERSWWNASASDGSINAVTLQVPVGPVRLVQRLQWGRTDYLQRAVPFGFGQRQIQSTASYSPGPWGSVNYQQSTQWFDDGRLQQWDEVASILQIGRHTSVQFVTAFPDVSDPRRFRTRVTQQLSPTLSLEAQYGRLSAFQKVRASFGEESRVMVTIRKTWQLDSPARGGDVRGQALDQAGYPVPGALVRLGPYSTTTDDAGRYAFTRVPDGRFELALDKDTLPAAYALNETPRPLTITRSSRAEVDLQVVPLNAIGGRVYLDRNGNGSYDEGEGIEKAVVMLNESVTATSATGAYAFYNQPPGRYKVGLDVSRLPKGVGPVSPAERDIELPADGPVFGIDFVVLKKDMPVIMKEVSR